ncbi:MAG: tripartite tricarboxylate transporter TctB family protein [Armatimonadota bacterium]|nr:tripartite tricarboxylate transporter TctB family protein [Armatimonadota bacterium]
MRKAEAVVASLLLLGGGVMLRQALKLPIGWTDTGPGSGFFPFWLAVGVLLSGAVILVQSLKRLAAQEGGGVDVPFLERRSVKPLLAVLLPIAGVVALIDYFGIYVGGFLYLVGYMRFVGRFRWPTILLVSTAIPFVLFLIFERWFLLPMPKGVILETLLYGGK